MKRNEKVQILCYGDSNTWGCIPRWEESCLPSLRYDEQHRWPTVLQARLGTGFQVVAEGLGGRTTIYHTDAEPWKNGESYLLPCLRSHRPLDLVIIMLGTNDLQAVYHVAPGQLKTGIARLAEMVRQDPTSGRDAAAPQVLLLAPIEVRKSAPQGRTAVFEKFQGEAGASLSRQFATAYAEVAKETGCYFLDAARFAQPSPADGIHFDPDSHVRLGEAIAELIVQEIFVEGK